MNTIELMDYMLKDDYIRKYYGGVYASDNLPVKPKGRKVYIINTDPSHLPGKHWVTVYTDRIYEYFDSLSKSPQNNIHKFMKADTKSYLTNTSKLQYDHSTTCGLFCLFYCYFRCRGFSFKRIIDMFNSNDLLYNDSLVEEFYKLTKK